MSAGIDLSTFEAVFAFTRAEADRVRMQPIDVANCFLTGQHHIHSTETAATIESEWVYHAQRLQHAASGQGAAA